jgi:short-subunit dehydrogenase
MNLQGRSILITGAGSGIGRELALILADSRARLVLTGRRAEPLHETQALIAKHGGGARIIAGDVREEAHRREALDAALAAHGALHVLINNAGNVAAGRLEASEEADIRAMVEVNLLAPILFTRAALPHLRKSGGGMVVNIASGMGLIGMPFYSVYCATKGGFARFGEALRRELKGEGVHVLTAFPAATETPMMATSGIGPATGVTRESPQSVAKAIVEGMEQDALNVISGGAPRLQQIALNNTTPEVIDEQFAARKPRLESAVKRHRSI